MDYDTGNEATLITNFREKKGEVIIWELEKTKKTKKIGEAEKTEL